MQEAGYFNAAIEAVLAEAQMEGRYEETVSYLEGMIGHKEEYYRIDEAAQPILIYKGDPVCYNILTIFAEQLGAALERRGERVLYFDQEEHDPREIIQFKGRHFKAVIGVQSCAFSIKMEDEVHYLHAMHEPGSINFDELGRIIEDQIAHHTDAIIICGTTGECSTMTDEEQLAAIKYTVDVVNHRVPVIAGAGSNDTDHGCALAAKSAECGADALLMVTPYYNKTSQAGLVAHFTAMAEAGGIPVIMYNVPSRTGLNIAPETALELSKHPLINGIKEASGNISQVAKIAQLCGDELNIYSGNDDQVVPLLALGGKGVISVVSNVKPELVHNCCKAFFDGDTAKARELQLEMLPLADALFCEVNPIPVKYAMNVLGWEAGECRLPLVEPSEAHKEYIEKALRAEGLIKE